MRQRMSGKMTVKFKNTFEKVKKSENEKKEM